MSDELFDGHIASYMSLTDCWVLGILPVPTYVTAGYSINGYIEDLGERIAKEESAGRRAELLADFNELRDCASRAANLPAIFQKYFEGIEKVIVFCPNVFELNEIEKMCPQRFSRVNGNVHTYVVHSSNPFGTSEYDGFKEDDDETAIKLLLCVNQLNEGVHIKGVDAVIMVRRTSSPTIFYQQLGRALTAAGNFEPLVIDLVDNFEMIGIEQIVNMMSDVCNMALRGKWVAIKNQFYCFESMYSPDMDLTEIRGLAGWIVNLETREMFPTTTEAAKAAGTSRSVVLDHVKNKVKPQNKRFSYVRDWDGKVGRLVDLNVQMICLETDTIYHSYDEICAAIWSDGYD